MLYATHERFDFWTWGDAGCCLPRGATSATLRRRPPGAEGRRRARPRRGRGPDDRRAGRRRPREARRRPADAASCRRSTRPAGSSTTPPTNAAVDVTEIAWDEADALPFPLCISVEEQPGLVVGEAWGNIVLADHGRTIAGEPLGEVPAPVLAARRRDGCDPCEHERAEPVPVRFRPTLASAPLTHARPRARRSGRRGPADAGARRRPRVARRSAPLLHDWLEERGFAFRAGPAVVRGGDDAWSVSDGVTVALLRATAATLTVLARPRSATATIAADPRAARPAVELEGTLLGATEPWRPQADLLGQRRRRAGVRRRGRARRQRDAALRRRRPRPPARDGHGVRRRPTGSATASPGNVGAGAIAHVVDAATATILGATNPLPAAGGTDPEPADAVRRDAPEAFLVQERAVTAADYARVTERNRAGAARGRDVPLDRLVAHRLRHRRPRRRRCAVDADVRDRAARATSSGSGWPATTSRSTGRASCRSRSSCTSASSRDYFRAHVQAAVLDVLSSRVRADGTLGFFHPDRFTFGQPVYLSAIVAAAQARRRASQSVTAADVPAPARRRLERARHRRAADGPARDRPARRRPELPRARRAQR